MILNEASREVRFFTYSSSSTLSIATILDAVGTFSGIKIACQGAGGGGTAGATNAGNGSDAQVSFTTSLGGSFSVFAEGGKGGVTTIHTGVQGGIAFAAGGTSFYSTSRFGGGGAPGFYAAGPDLASFNVGGGSFFGGGCSRTLSASLPAAYGTGGAGGRSEIIGISGVTHVFGGSGSAGGYVETNFIPKDFIASDLTISLGFPGSGTSGIGPTSISGGSGEVGYICITVYK